MLDNYENKLIFKVIGSGTAVPRVERGSPGNLVIFNSNKFLLDCGSGVLRQMTRIKESYKDLTGVIFSHFHPDHVSDFIPLIQALSYTPGFERKEDLLLIGPQGLEKFISGLYDAYNFQPRGFKTICVEMNGKYSPAKNIFIESIKGNHTSTSSIIKMIYLDNDGRERGFVYSGDTDFDENIAEFAKNIDLLVLECSFPYKVENHLTPEEAGRIAQIAKPGKLLLTHLYPPCDNPDVKIQHRVKEFFIGQVLVAQDYTEIII